MEATFARKMGKGFAYKAELGAVIEGVSVAILKGWSKFYLANDITCVPKMLWKNNTWNSKKYLRTTTILDSCIKDPESGT